MDKEEEIAILTNDIVTVCKESFLKPFPYQGCRKILTESEDGNDKFIPDLDMYFSNIAGCCSSAKEFTKLPQYRLSVVRESLEKSFFEQHPEYKKHESYIEPGNTPDLYADMIIYECARRDLLRLITLILDNLADEKQR
jgi:hypothetical protein